MIRLLREFRLIPVVLIATVCLFALKLVGLMFDGKYILGRGSVRGDNFIEVSLAPQTQELSTPTVTLENWSPPKEKRSWVRNMLGFLDTAAGASDPVGGRSNDVVTTGSVGAKPAAKEGKDEKAAPPAPKTNGTVIPLDESNRPVSPAERAILERLHERRQELDKRARELDMRENMLKEAESKLDARMNELKALETQYGPGGKKKEESEAARMKGLVTMYENMKAKDAAKIFDRLDIKVLIEMATQINPRRMSDIMAQMNPEAAEKLTNELAARATGAEKTVNPSDLPKIEGKPSGS
jgi:flagellar motility protein MotE (MotC chaperone)